jgi:hypothetical protein
MHVIGHTMSYKSALILVIPVPNSTPSYLDLDGVRPGRRGLSTLGCAAPDYASDNGTRHQVSRRQPQHLAPLVPLRGRWRRHVGSALVGRLSLSERLELSVKGRWIKPM